MQGKSCSVCGCKLPAPACGFAVFSVLRFPTARAHDPSVTGFSFCCARDWKDDNTHHGSQMVSQLVVLQRFQCQYFQPLVTVISRRPNLHNDFLRTLSRNSLGISVWRLYHSIASMSDARALFRATMSVQIGPCRGGDSFLEDALKGIVIWWSLPAVYDFRRGPKHQALRRKAWKTFLEAEDVGPGGLPTGAHWHRQCVRTMVCGANLNSHVHALRRFCSYCCEWSSAHAQTWRVEFLVEAAKAFLS